MKKDFAIKIRYQSSFRRLRDMKCPKCGKELTKNDVLYPLFNEKGEPLGHIHMSRKNYDEIMEMCDEYDLDGFHTFFALQFESFLEALFLEVFDKKPTFEKVMEKSALIFMNKLKALKSLK